MLVPSKISRDASPEYGTIRIPQGAVEPDEEEESTDFVRLVRGQDATAVTVETEYGDIRIREK